MTLAPPEATLSPRNEEELSWLLNDLTLSPGFTLSLAWTPDEATAQAVVQALRARLELPYAVLDVRHWPEEVPFLDWLLAVCGDSRQPEHVCIVTGFAGMDMRRHPLRQLNRNRNYWKSAAPCHWIFVFPPYEQFRAMAQAAGEPPFSLGDEMPDVYSIRSGDFTFETVRTGPAAKAGPDFGRVPTEKDFTDAFAAVEMMNPASTPAAMISYARALATEFLPLIRYADEGKRRQIAALIDRVTPHILPPAVAAAVAALKVSAVRGTGEANEAAAMQCMAALDDAEPLARGPLPEDDLWMLAGAISLLLQRDDHRPPYFEKPLRKLARYAEENIGPQAKLVAVVLADLCALLVRQLRFEEAEELARRILNICIQNEGPHSLGVALWLLQLGRVLTIKGRFHDAEALLHQALEIRRSSLGSNHPDVLEVLTHLIYIYRLQGRTREAEALRLQVAEIESTSPAQAPTA